MMAVKIERINLAPILVYVIGLVTMLAFSAAYSMPPIFAASSREAPSSTAAIANSRRACAASFAR